MPPLTLAMTDRRGAGRSAMVTCVATLPESSPDRRAPRRSSKVRRALRLGAKPQGQRRDVFRRSRRLLAALTAEQQARLAAKINAPTGPGTGPKKNRRNPFGSRRLELLGFQDFQRAGDGLEPATSSLGSWHSTN